MNNFMIKSMDVKVKHAFKVVRYFGDRDRRILEPHEKPILASASELLVDYFDGSTGNKKENK